MYSSIMYENPPSDVVRSSILSVKLPTQKFVQEKVIWRMGTKNNAKFLVNQFLFIAKLDPDLV